MTSLNTFKVGDLVQVFRPNYVLTGVGSYGTIRSIYSQTCIVDFEFITSGHSPCSFPISLDDIKLKKRISTKEVKYEDQIL